MALKTTMVKILVLVDGFIVIVGEGWGPQFVNPTKGHHCTTALPTYRFPQHLSQNSAQTCGSIQCLGGTSAGGDVVSSLYCIRTNDDPDTGCMASVDHVLELLPRAALGCENVRDRLVIRPPFWARDVLLCCAHCGMVNTRHAGNIDNARLGRIHSRLGQGTSYIPRRCCPSSIRTYGQ